MSLHLMDIVTTYLYEPPENDIYMKLLEGFNFPNNANPRKDYSIKLNKSIYGIR